MGKQKQTEHFMKLIIWMSDGDELDGSMVTRKDVGNVVQYLLSVSHSCQYKEKPHTVHTQNYTHTIC